MSDSGKSNTAAVVAFGLLVSILAPATAVGQQQDKVIDLRVEGNQRISDQDVLAKVKMFLGQSYDDSVVKGDKQRLLDSGQFESVIVTKSQTEKGIILTFIVTERPVVTKITFIGNKAYNHNELAKELPFNASDPLNRFNVNAGKKAIAEKYKSDGYHSVAVEVDLRQLKEANRAVYHIIEGPRASVRKVTFDGNSHFRNWQLRQVVGTSKKFWPFIPGNMDPEQLKNDVTTLRNYYVAAGFLDCEVAVDKPLDFSYDKKKVTVKFLITEGARYRVNDVIFKGNTVFSNAELARRLKLARGLFFTSESLHRDVRKLEATYGELGYVEAHVKATRQFLSPDAPLPPWAAVSGQGKIALLNVVFNIEESDQYKFGQIRISGNNVTQSRIIRRQMRFFPEQMFNTVAVEESRKRLLETGLFQEVTITPVKGARPQIRDVLVTVKEGKTAEFLVGVGVSTNHGLLGNVSFTQRNFNLFKWPASWSQFIRGQAFKGAGQTFKVMVEPGTKLMRFRLEWFEPSLMGTTYSLGVKTFLWDRKRDDYDETRYGGVVTVGHKFRNRWYAELASRIEGVDIGELDDDIAPEIEEDAGTHLMTGLKGTIIRDRTNSKWMPSRGDRFRFSYEQVVGDYNFGKTFADYRFYHTLKEDGLDRKHILASRFAAGSIIGNAPVFEKFYGGGTGSLRGFQYRGISPRSDTTDDAIGGDCMIFAGTEYNFPIFGKQLRGVVFLDSGTVEENFSLSNYRVSVGVGLRWIVPMLGPVPLSLDFGFPISKHGDDETQILSFSLGWTF